MATLPQRRIIERPIPTNYESLELYILAELANMLPDDISTTCYEIDTIAASYCSGLFRAYYILLSHQESISVKNSEARRAVAVTMDEVLENINAANVRHNICDAMGKPERYMSEEKLLVLAEEITSVLWAFADSEHSTRTRDDSKRVAQSMLNPIFNLFNERTEDRDA